MNNDSVIVKNLSSQEQITVKVDELIDKFDELLTKEETQE